MRRTMQIQDLGKKEITDSHQTIARIEVLMFNKLWISQAIFQVIANGF